MNMIELRSEYTRRRKEAALLYAESTLTLIEIGEKVGLNRKGVDLAIQMYAPTRRRDAIHAQHERRAAEIMAAREERKRRASAERHRFAGCLADLYRRTEFTVDEIAAMMDIDPGTLYDSLSLIGVPRRQPQHAVARSDWEIDELDSQVRCMYRAGETLQKIINATGYCERTVLRKVRKAGLERRLQCHDPERLALACTLLSRGVSLNKTYARTGVSPRVLSVMARKMGAFVRKPGQRFFGDRPRDTYGAQLAAG
jgi:hypothetical protein